MVQFSLGRIVATKAVWELMEADTKFNRFVSGCLTRYMMNDWGELDPEDWEANEESVQHDLRILASYPIPDGIDGDYEDRLWIITEADRTVTTLLFPSEY